MVLATGLGAEGCKYVYNNPVENQDGSPDTDTDTDTDSDTDTGLCVPSWIQHVVADDFLGVRSVHAEDIDGNDTMDILGAANEDDAIVWWENSTGDGASLIEHIIDSSFDMAASVHTADVDGDGDMDVLGAAGWAHQIAWWENADSGGNGSTWFKHVVGAGFNGAVSVYPADLDGDDDVDLLGAGFYEDKISWWENIDPTGNGSSWLMHDVSATSDNLDGPRSVQAIDMDGDDDLDVLGTAYETGSIVWWENDGEEAWTVHVISNSFDGVFQALGADIDGDDDPDIIAAAEHQDTIAWWENTDGIAGTWTEHIVDNQVNGALSIYPSDINGDGVLDIVGAANEGDEITWWQNSSGDGSEWPARFISTDFGGAFYIYAEDIDGDGDNDVLGAAHDDNLLVWWENDCI